MLEQEKPRRTIAERIRKKEPKPKKAKTPKKREVCRVEIEPGESRIMQCPRPMLVTAPQIAFIESDVFFIIYAALRRR